MTYEELLAELNQASKDFEIVVGDNPYYKALRAVVELHKPNEFYDCCNACDSDLPCATIQAIEKELLNANR